MTLPAVNTTCLAGTPVPRLPQDTKSRHRGGRTTNALGLGTTRVLHVQTHETAFGREYYPVWSSRTVRVRARDNELPLTSCCVSTRANRHCRESRALTGINAIARSRLHVPPIRVPKPTARPRLADRSDGPSPGAGEGKPGPVAAPQPAMLAVGLFSV